jgi:hypothetical protein
LSTSSPATPARIEGGLLRAAHDFVDFDCLLAWITGGEGAGAVRAVAVDRRSHVEHHQLPVADLALAWLGVRQCPVRPGGDDRRERGVAAELADPRFEGTRDLALGPAGKPLFGAPPQSLVSQLRGLLDQRQLAVVLDPAQLLDPATGGRHLDAVGEFLLQFLQQPHRHVVVLEPDPALQVPGDPAEPVVGDRQDLPALDLGFGPLGVAEVGEEETHAWTADAGAVGAGEAGQVADVDQVQDQHPVELALAQLLLEPVATAAHQEEAPS